MNTVKGVIKTIVYEGEFHFITVDSKTQPFKLLTLELSDYFRSGRVVSMIFKETEVAVAKGSSEQVSMANQIPSKIVAIHVGRIMTQLELISKVGRISSLITTDSFLRLNLKIGDKVTALIKATEISLMDSGA